MPTPRDKGSMRRTPMTVMRCFESREESLVLVDEKRVKLSTRPTITSVDTRAIPRIPPYTRCPCLECHALQRLKNALGLLKKAAVSTSFSSLTFLIFRNPL